MANATKCNNNEATEEFQLIYHGVAKKATELTPEEFALLKKIHARSTTYGVGTKSINNFMDFCKNEIAKYHELTTGGSYDTSKFAAICEAFHISDDRETFKAYTAICWAITEAKTTSEITLPALLKAANIEDDLGGKGRSQLAYEFNHISCIHDELVTAGFNGIGITRFAKLVFQITR